MVFKTIFLKTLYEKRWMAWWWMIGGLLLVLFIMLFFPTLRDSLGASLKDVPESMRAILGDAAAYQTITGYVDLQVFEQMAIFPIILGIIVCTGLLAGEEGEGTLQTLLSYPVSRDRIYIQKLLAAVTILGIVCLVTMFGGIMLGAIAIGQTISAGGVLLATLMAWLVSICLSVLGYAIGAATGRRGLAGAIAGAVAFVSFTVTSLVKGIDALTWPEHLSPFHYYHTLGPLQGNFSVSDASVLLAASLALAIAGCIMFRRRDIYPR